MEHLALYFVPSLITFIVLFLGHCFYLERKGKEMIKDYAIMIALTTMVTLSLSIILHFIF